MPSLSTKHGMGSPDPACFVQCGDQGQISLGRRLHRQWRRFLQARGQDRRMAHPGGNNVEQNGEPKGKLNGYRGRTWPAPRQRCLQESMQ